MFCQGAIDVGLEPALGNTSGPSNASKGEPFEHESVYEGSGFGFDGLPCGIFNKLASTVTATVTLFAVVGASELDEVFRLTPRAVHGGGQTLGETIPL